MVLQHGGNTPHLVVIRLSLSPPLELNGLVFLVSIFAFCLSSDTGDLFGRESCPL